MTTSIFSAAPDMTSDATFRAWGSAVSANLATVGLIQTADTGQIDWATVTVGGTGVIDGYEIWRFNDALQATAPVFLKLGYGTAGAGIPDIQLQVGTGSNGSGTLTGTVTTGTPNIGYANSGSSASTKNSSVAYNGGSFAFQGFAQTVSAGFMQPQMFMAVSRPYNSAGAYTGAGVQIYYFSNSGYQNLASQALNFVTATARPVDLYSNYSFIPGSGSQTTTAISGDPQIYAHWASLPGVVLIPGMVTVMSTDVVANTTFSVAIAGSTARTYLRLDATWSGAQVPPPSTNITALAMIWE